MRASVYSAYAAPPTVERVDDPVPSPDGVVVAVRASGVCRSDWHAWMGHDPVELPHVGGHELAGEVVAVGREVTSLAEGDRVTVPFCCGCGRCESCLAGETQVCEIGFQPGFTAWGSFAELVALPGADLNVVRLPEALGYVEAASLGCRFMTSWSAVRVHARVEPGEWVAIHGCGGVGLAATMIAAAAGGRVIAIDVAPDKLELARSLGAAETVDATGGDAAAQIVELTGGGAHVSIDALGSAVTCAASVRSLRRRGRHVQVGLPLGPDAEPRLPMMDVISRELRLEGCHGMAVRHYPALLAAIAGGQLDPSRLIGRTIGLDDVGAELQSMGSFAQRGVTVMRP